MWFYQEVEEAEVVPVIDINKPSTSRQAPPVTNRQIVTKKKKLFLTDGWDFALTGMCIYIFRTSTHKQLPEEGFQKVCC